VVGLVAGAGQAARKGADGGIDGVITFFDDTSGKPKRVIVQVKSGHVQRGDIGQLVGTIEREKAALGVFITLEEPSAPMRQEALAAGTYRSDEFGKDYPRIQILTIAELLHGAEIKMPPTISTFKRAERVRTPEAAQATFDTGE
jgi:site-specific DNA-methyltransferase (adenine-specific)